MVVFTAQVEVVLLQGLRVTYPHQVQLSIGLQGIRAADHSQIDSKEFELPITLVLEEIFADMCSWETFVTALTPCLLLVSFHMGFSSCPNCQPQWEPIEYSSLVIPTLSHGAPSPSDFNKNFSGLPSPPRRIKRKKKVTLAPKKRKAKTLPKALPIPASSADLDAAINAAAKEDFDNEVKQKRPTSPVGDTSSKPTQSTEPTPAVEILATLVNPTSGPGAKHKDLSNLILFDIGQYMEPIEADVSANSSLFDELKSQLSDILARLDFPIETLINNAGPLKY
uniref:Uncharacterized protein n=1 Tax=Oryza brachyantha TaxID=4533 RepID=J3KUK4_ORYBR